MTRKMITEEIDRLKVRLERNPTHFFTADRRKRVADLEAQLATMPADVEPMDPGFIRMLELQGREERVQRAMERRGY